MDSELGQDAGNVVPLGSDGDVEQVGDRLAAEPASERLQHLDLARGQALDRGAILLLRLAPETGVAQQPTRAKDRARRAARTAAEIDRRLSQDLVDRFVRAGATNVFVGPGTGLTGPPGVVQVMAYHDDHLHVRIAPSA